MVLWILARQIGLESVREDWRCLKHRAEMHPAVRGPSARVTAIPT
jgi:hypothetical protein